jgi:hypothetical protein
VGPARPRARRNPRSSRRRRRRRKGGGRAERCLRRVDRGRVGGSCAVVDLVDPSCLDCFAAFFIQGRAGQSSLGVRREWNKNGWKEGIQRPKYNDAVPPLPITDRGPCPYAHMGGTGPGSLLSSRPENGSKLKNSGGNTGSGQNWARTEPELAA